MKTNNHLSKLIKLADRLDRKLKLAQQQQPFNLAGMVGALGQMAGGIMNGGYGQPQQPSYPQQEPYYPARIESQDEQILRLFQEIGEIAATLPRIDPRRYISYMQRITQLANSASRADFSNMFNMGAAIDLLNQVIALKGDINRDFGDNQAAKKIVAILDRAVDLLVGMTKKHPETLNSAYQNNPLVRAVLDSVHPDRAAMYAKRITRLLDMVAGLDNSFSNPALSLQIRAEVDSLKRDLEREVGPEKVKYILRLIDWTVSGLRL